MDPQPRVCVFFAGPVTMAHCKAEQDDWLIVYLKYLLFVFNFFFWVSEFCTPMPFPSTKWVKLPLFLVYHHSGADLF